MTSSIKSLGSISKFVNGGTPPKQNSEYWSGDILWISSADIENDVITSKRHYITQAAVEASATNRVPKGTLLVVTRTGVGKTAIADEDLCFSQDITAVYLPSDCDPRYVRFAIQSNREYLVKNARGATIKGVTRQMLADLQIPLPPLAAQRRIAEQLDTADRILRLREQAIAKLDQLAQSVFARNFSMSEKTEKIGSLFAINKNRLDMSISDEDEIGFIPMAAISEHTKAIEIYEQRKFYEVRKGYTPIKRGDLLVAKITPCYENGKMAIAEFPNGEYAFGSTEFHTFRSDNPLMITYLYYFLMDEKIRLDGARNMRGAAGQRRVPAEYFSNLDIPIPPPDDLATFCRFVTETNKLRSKASDAIKSSKALIASLQCQSFAVN